MTDNQTHKVAEQIINRARKKGLMIATAESCTGGWIGKVLTDIPGSSSVFMGSLVAYSNTIKETLLGVSQNLLITHGAVSQPVASAMAKNCAQSFAADIALSVTGIAGPGGGSVEKPVGLVHMGLYCAGQTRTYEFQFDNFGRNSVREEALREALKIILQAIDTETSAAKEEGRKKQSRATAFEN